MVEIPIRIEADGEIVDPHAWMGRVLDHFAKAEQAIGRLCMAIDLPISNGLLGSLSDLRSRLTSVGSRQFKALDNRIDRWSRNRPFRHLLAHATIINLFDASGTPVIITRHLPRDATDVTPDRVWTSDEQSELLRKASADSRSICDQVKNILADPTKVALLAKK